MWSTAVYECVLRRIKLLAIGIVLGYASVSVGAGSPAGKPTLKPKVKISTTAGDLILELDATEAPNAVMSFVHRVKSGYYNGLVFHRVLRGRLIQAGAYLPDMTKRSVEVLDTDVADFDNALSNARGTISAVKASEWNNKVGAEFFINVDDNFFFDDPKGSGPYPVFGHVVAGMQWVDQIASAPVGPHPRYATGLSPFVPKKPIVIKSIKMLSPLDREGAMAAASSLVADSQKGIEEAKRAFQRLVDGQIEKIKKATGHDVTVTKSGLVYGDVRKGIGPQPMLDDNVLVHYRGTLLDGTELTTTYDKKPVERKVRDFIKGMRIALTTMKEGGKRIVIVPPDLGFGVGGAPSIGVPRDAFLVFDIELLEIRYDKN